MKFAITLSWSKIVAVLVLGCAVALDIINKTASTFMFAIPFVVALISGKQIIDGTLNKKPHEVD